MRDQQAINVLKRLFEDAVVKGAQEYDPRFVRNTKTICGASITLGSLLLESIKKEPLADKYKDDYTAMWPYLRECFRELTRNAFSRRMVCINTDDYLERFPCFLTAQFLHTPGTKTPEYILLINQRSSDLEKFVDDSFYFSYLANQFEKATGASVTRITIFFGSLHKECQ